MTSGRTTEVGCDGLAVSDTQREGAIDSASLSSDPGKLVSHKPQRPKPSSFFSVAPGSRNIPLTFQQQSLEDLERGENLTSPFTSPAGAWTDHAFFETRPLPRSPLGHSPTTKAGDSQDPTITPVSADSDSAFLDAESGNQPSSSLSFSSFSSSPSTSPNPNGAAVSSPNASISDYTAPAYHGIVECTTPPTRSFLSAAATLVRPPPPGSGAVPPFLDDFAADFGGVSAQMETGKGKSPGSQKQQQLELALAEDGFLSSPGGSEGGESSGKSACPPSTPTSTSDPPPEDLLFLFSPTLVHTPSSRAATPRSTPRHTTRRRLSMPGLPFRATPRSISSNAPVTASARGTGILSLDSIRVKLATGLTPRSTLSEYAPVHLSPTLAKAQEQEHVDAPDGDDILLVQSAHRLGLDITGLRKALLVRVLGVEPTPPRPTSPPSPPPFSPATLLFGSARKQTIAHTDSGSVSPARPTTKRTRSASAGVMPTGWLRRAAGGQSHGAGRGGKAGKRISETYRFVLWVLDLESGEEWRVRKGPSEMLALHEAVSVMRPGSVGIDGIKFPLKRHKSETNPPSLEKQARLEQYLRRLTGVSSSHSMVTSSPPSPLGPAAKPVVPSQETDYEVAKVLQDFLGATERVDELTTMAHTVGKGDPQRSLRRRIQVCTWEGIRKGIEINDGGGGGESMQAKLEVFVKRTKECDVQETDLLRAYSDFLGRSSRQLLDTVPFGGSLRNMARTTLTSPSMASGSGEVGEADVDRFCLAEIRRVLEAETFLPLRLRLYERVMVETDIEEEKRLAQKCAIFQARPQSFFGIAVENISISSWEAAVGHLRRLSGEITTLPSDKLDALVAAVREIHACHRREHGDATDLHLGADEFLPVFIYVVSQCGISRLVALKNMLAALGDPARMMSEAGYCLASLEGAIEYLLQLEDTAEEI
ncbi:hypothetical protein NSK_001146 [Nannochloropsis salina CCMP1776]|uniref:VPS9 domain-containing protein n=1 Tax=Nannochloropsis salina CCMP1776 TaxID=1027361 RepID=A0A4D9DGA1_9STRA|nr:hypothetical protein NSK_001146 [Nannochloropsis salina CCMP1776]|eukprot:TFJ87799.1 hypothetical protein NSK_001146 [Nannochloropsis salina CCMP1776]